MIVLANLQVLTDGFDDARIEKIEGTVSLDHLGILIFKQENGI